MAVLDEALAHHYETTGAGLGSPAETDGLSGYFWTWYNEHYDDKITSIRFLFINVTVRVHHLYALFTLLFGQEPEV